MQICCITYIQYIYVIDDAYVTQIIKYMFLKFIIKFEFSNF